MTPAEAIDLANRVKGLIPTANEQQRDMLAAAFEPYTASDVFEAIDDHVKTHKFLNIHDLMEQIELQSRKHSSSAMARLSRETEAAEQRISATQQRQQQADAERAEAVAIVSALSEPEYKRLEAEVLASLPGMTPGKWMIRHIAKRARMAGVA